MCFNIYSLITQIYFYASYIFKEAGISAEHTQYATIGTGTCEFTACILCVSFKFRGFKVQNCISGWYIGYHN